MSLETAIAANTAAIEKLHDAFLNVAEVLAGIRTNVVAQHYAEQKATQTEPALTEPEAAKATEAVIEKAKATPAPKVEALDYATTAKFVTDLANSKGRDAAVAIMQQFSAKTLKDIPVEKYAEVVAACEKALA